MRDPGSEKADLRDAMRSARRQMTPKEQEEAARLLFAGIRAFEPYRQARVVMGYMACRGEISLEPVLDDVIARGRMLALPRCEAGNRLTARRTADIIALTPGLYGLREPGEDFDIIDPQAIDLIFVPGTAFGMDGTRIGQGGGYYDRFLKNTRALRVGVCHDLARFHSVPSAAHDQRMDYLITPSGIFACR